MFSIALVVFREVLEVSIVIGVILAATKGVPGRAKWTLLGILGGIVGSGLVAYFIEEISGFAEGVGQEIFNAGILIVAAIMIAWTVIWMRTHAREMVRKIRAVGQQIKDGHVQMISISIVIALATLREGSEIALFGNGILLSGHLTAAEFFTGAFIGLGGGALVGAMLYFGMLKISTKHIFKITGWLLIFLAAGMMSIAASYLVSAGIFDVLIDPVWDTSSILPDSSLLGKILSVLIGYTAIPMGIQLVFYISTLGVLTMCTKLIDVKHSKKQITATAAAIMLVLLSGNNAEAKKVYSPYVEKGELELEYQGTYGVDNEKPKDGEQENKFGVGYGFTNYWFSELYANEARPSGSDQPYSLEELEWENRFQLTEPGEYWADFGFLAEYEMPIADSHAPDEMQVLALIEKDYDKFATVLNLGFVREIGENSAPSIEAVANMSARYRWMPEFEPGIEIYNNFGHVNDFNGYRNQEHQIGPVAYGNLGHGFSYDVGYLFGPRNDAPDGEFKVVLEYGIPLY